MSLKKATRAFLLGSLMLVSSSIFAIQINNFATLTEKQIKSSYFFDWNRNSTFRGALFKAFKSSGVTMPTWLRKGGGGSAPAKVINSGNTHFVLLDTCSPKECAKNTVFVLFDPASKATFVVAKLDNKITWIGQPTAAAKQILSKASGF